MSRMPLVVRLPSVVVLTLAAQVALAGTTVVAGNPTCRPTNLPSYPTITAALAAVPVNGTVLVCPQTFNEQVTITQAVTLEGVSNGNMDQPVLLPPSGGLTLTATDSFSRPVAYQLWVNNVSGAVNISNITIDGTGNLVSGCFPWMAGIFYQNSSGTVNRVTTRNQKGNGCGFGIDAEGGGSNPSVTIENSSIHDFDNSGVITGTNSGSSELTATIKGNSVDTSASAFIGAYLLQGGTDTVTGNFFSGASAGIDSTAGTVGSISGNTVMNSNNFGIFVAGDGLSVTSNRIMFSGIYGIYINSAVATISANSITSAPIGIEFNCMANPNVKSNAITDAATGVDQVPSGTSTPNTYVNVAAIKASC